MGGRLDRSFFNRNHLEVARDLIGCQLVWEGVRGIVVETEGYAAADDPACHTASRPSARQFWESHGPGTIYAYISYGVHWMLNVLAGDGIILFRALEPCSGLDVMQRRRGRCRDVELCSGPGKLGQAIALSAANHGQSLLSVRRHLRGRAGDFDPTTVVADLRVGITKAADRPWRFLLHGNPHVSVAPGRTATRRPR